MAQIEEKPDWMVKAATDATTNLINRVPDVHAIYYTAIMREVINAIAAHAPAAGEGERNKDVCVRCNGACPEAYKRNCHQCGAPLCDHVCEEWHLEKDCKGVDAKPSEHSAHVRELVKAARKAMEQIGMEFVDEAYETLDAALAHFERKAHEGKE